MPLCCDYYSAAQSNRQAHVRPPTRHETLSRGTRPFMSEPDKKTPTPALRRRFLKTAAVGSALAAPMVSKAI